MKLNFSIIIFLLIQSSLFLYGSDTGTQKYVWAIQGLNVRSSPNIKASIVKTLMFGDSIIILETTNIPYTKKVIDTLYFYNEPIYLKDAWVKIRAGSIEGYVVNAYLLVIPCPMHDEPMNEYGRRMAARFKHSDLSYNLPIEHGTVVGGGSQCEFPSGKLLGYSSEEDEKEILMKLGDDFEKEGSGGGGYFKYFTLQEVLIFLNPFYEIQERGNKYMDLPYKVYINEPNRISLTDNSTQTIDIYIYESGEIIFLYENSGC
jgi:hypothetical protein